MRSRPSNYRTRSETPRSASAYTPSVELQDESRWSRISSDHGPRQRPSLRDSGSQFQTDWDLASRKGARDPPSRPTGRTSRPAVPASRTAGARLTLVAEYWPFRLPCASSEMHSGSSLHAELSPTRSRLRFLRKRVVGSERVISHPPLRATVEKPYDQIGGHPCTMRHPAKPPRSRSPRTTAGRQPGPSQRWESR